MQQSGKPAGWSQAQGAKQSLAANRERVDFGRRPISDLPGINSAELIPDYWYRLGLRERANIAAKIVTATACSLALRMGAGGKKRRPARLGASLDRLDPAQPVGQDANHRQRLPVTSPARSQRPTSPPD